MGKFECDQCGKFYASKQSMLKHQETTCGKPHKNSNEYKTSIKVGKLDASNNKTVNNDNSKTKINKTKNITNIDNSVTNNNNITIHVPILYDTRYPDLTKDEIDALVKKYYVEQNLANIIPDIYTEPKNASFKVNSSGQLMAFYSPDGAKFPRWLPIDMEKLRYKIVGAIEDNLGDIIFQTHAKKKEPNYASFKFQDDMREPPPPRLLKIQEKAIKSTAKRNKDITIIPDGREEGVYCDTDRESVSE